MNKFEFLRIGSLMFAEITAELARGKIIEERLSIAEKQIEILSSLLGDCRNHLPNLKAYYQSKDVSLVRDDVITLIEEIDKELN